MDYVFSKRISSLRPSAIREILKVTMDPSVISFAAGNPSAETFPVETFGALAAEIFGNNGKEALQYGISEGYTPLRSLTAQRLKTVHNTGGEDDEIIIVSGGQQGIELSCKALCDEGDTVLCEDPSFIGALNAFRSYDCRLTGLPVDRDGLDPDRVEAACKKDRRIKLLYTIPTFQNPSGVTLSEERRLRLTRLAEKYGFYILEDSPYLELRYEGNPVPTIKSLDSSGRVIYVGSYSKILSPGMRIGFVCAPAPVISKLTVAKQVSDVHTNLFFSMLVARFLQTKDVDAHIAGINALYVKKRDRMLDGLKNLPDGVETGRPDGGIFIWCGLPPGSNATDFCRALSHKKVAAVPGAAFSPDENAVCRGFRLNFTTPSDDQIDRGCEILAQTAREFLRP